jgi:hypothetical protein
MARPHFRNSLCALFFFLFAIGVAAASEFHGRLTFNGLPLPGATVTAQRGAKKIVTASDQSGIFTFADLSDGAWKIVIEMQCFATVREDVTIAKDTPVGKWEMKLLPLDQVKATVQVPQTTLSSASAVSGAIPLIPRKKAEASQPGAAPEMPRPEEQAENSEKAADGFLVNGSVSNAATSQYAMDRAFGNTRKGSKGIYNYGIAAILGNSALDARPYSLSGFDTPKDVYDRVTMILTAGGPIKIPRLLPRGPNFFVSYQWTRNNNAALQSGIVPTSDERSGNLAGLLNALGQPVTVYDPATGVPFAGNVVPVSAQALALLKYYPLPNIANTSLYNYQGQVLDSSHQDVFQTRLDKNLGNKNGLYGGLNLQSTRAGSANFFGFVDTTDTLGLDGHINWWHRFNMRHYMNLGYHISRLRTEVVPNFANRLNIAAAAGINGVDPDPADWGPPSLGFSSGITGLSDAQSAFNRNRTDAFSASSEVYHGHHNVTFGGDFRKLEYNDFFQQNPEGRFSFTGAATAGADSAGSDLADFLIGVPDTSSIAYGNPDKYLREPVYDAYITDDWRMLPGLTINAGLRWEDDEPITELKGRLVNLDVATGFTAAAPVLGSAPIGAITGTHYPGSLIRPDRGGIEPRIGFAWRPIPASTVVVRVGYGIYRDSSVYQSSALQMAQQAPLSTSLSTANSAACQLSLANGFQPCAAAATDSFAMDPNFRVGYAQTWQLAIQRDLPGALQMTATYLGIKGTHGVQEFLPNTYPIGAANPCPNCPSGFAWRTSGGDSSRESGQLQMRRRLRSGFTATMLYTFSKSIDDDAYLGGQGQAASTGQGTAASASIAGSNASIAQNWRDLRGERSLSSFDQRHLASLQAQYTSGEGLKGGDLLTGWRGRVLKEWTIVANLSAGSGLPETPVYFAVVPGAAVTGTIRPSTTGASVYKSPSGLHLNPVAYSAPAAGQWGTAGRYSITGPNQFSLDSAMARTFRPNGRIYLDAQVSATNLLNHAAFTGWNTTVNSTQFGLPVAANPMRSLQTTLRLRF